MPLSGPVLSGELLAYIKDLVQNKVARQLALQPSSCLLLQHQFLTPTMWHTIMKEVANALPDPRQPTPVAESVDLLPLQPTLVVKPLSYGPPVVMLPAPMTMPLKYAEAIAPVTTACLCTCSYTSTASCHSAPPTSAGSAQSLVHK